ncbi:MAG: chemotaxis protein CheA [Tissierellales bacterium]|jgi:two-component system chemotaxis sensor kinase CheA|nr:chemotaxis protein CheA [Tissierellales bacterium]
MSSYSNEPMLEMYCLETNQLIDELENIIIDAEEKSSLETYIDEIFRIMHTIKGNSMMMMFEDIGNYAHSIEDLFDFFRKEKPENVNYSKVTDMVLELVDFTKQELEKIQEGQVVDGDAKGKIEDVKTFMSSLKFMNDIEEGDQKEEKTNDEDQKYYISSLDSQKVYTGESERAYYMRISFQEDCQMENIRAFTAVHNLKEKAYDIVHKPEDIVDVAAIDEIVKNGFQIVFRTKESVENIKNFADHIPFAAKVDYSVLEDGEYENWLEEFETGSSQKKATQAIVEKTKKAQEHEENQEKKLPKVEKKSSKKIESDKKSTSQNKKKQAYISVGVDKLDALMDLVGELVVSESMVTNNSELRDVELDDFYKAARQHRKNIVDLQDIVMSIRMVPLGPTFQKMNRIVRDICKKTEKKAALNIIGQDTEVDKNVIEHISDPLMHLIRNSVDHGIEMPEERDAEGKDERGTVTLEAKHSGGYVWIIVKDDGKGLDRTAIYNKAVDRGLADLPEENYSDKEIFNFILQPGFSTNTEVTEFSGRGVGMDVVVKNLEKIGGSIIIDSELGKGSEMSIKIPLTLAIIDGMVLRVGDSKFILPIASIKESFRPNKKDYLVEPDGQEMILVRGEAFPVKRVHEKFNIKDCLINVIEGIIVMTEHEDKTVCLFVDEIVGQQQVVVKSLSSYMQKVEGISGGALLGDGSISLILDPSGVINM